jgi:hypothetical protein
MEWYEEVKAIMEELGFTRCGVDYAVFIFDNVDSAGTRTFCIIGWHVDDSLGTLNSPPFLAYVKGKINARFGIKDLSPVDWFLGIQFKCECSSRRLWMHQSEYITYLLKEYGMLHCNPVLLPLDANFPFSCPSDVYPTIPNLASNFRKLIGELLYLAVCTRPDILYSVNSLAQFSAHPLACHYATAKRLLRYLTGTINVQLHYGGPCADELLHGYCDADWASSPEDHRSISGYAWFFAGRIIAYVSKKQATIALSSTEAKYMAITHVIQEGLWLKSLFTALHLPLTLPLVIHMDNTSAITLSKEACNHIRSKHIDVRYHFIRGHVSHGTFVPTWLPSHANISDIFTKALARPLFTKHLVGLCLVSR